MSQRRLNFNGEKQNNVYANTRLSLRKKIKFTKKDKVNEKQDIVGTEI